MDSPGSRVRTLTGIWNVRISSDDGAEGVASLFRLGTCIAQARDANASNIIAMSNELFPKGQAGGRAYLSKLLMFALSAVTWLLAFHT